MSDALICNACQIHIRSAEERASHYKQEWHRYNVKRRCAGLASIPQALFDRQLAALTSKKAEAEQQKASLHCKACKKSFGTPSAYNAHIASKKHLKKVEKGDVAAAAADDDEEEEEEEAEEGAAAAPAVAAAGASAPADAAAAPPGGVVPASKAAASVVSKREGADDAEMGEDMEEDGEADEEGEEDEEFEGDPIPLLHCLFCRKHFNAVPASVEHMLKSHGFFIPFVDNLVDLEGMLTYLGEKIGLGHMCLWCQARFPSQAAVQQHMKAKSHCKLRLETEEEEEELLDFYDFDMDDEEDDDEGEEDEEAAEEEKTEGGAKDEVAKPASQALIATGPAKVDRRSGGGGASSINDAGELVLADGSIVGTRALKHIYKQHARPSQDVSVIAGKYKALALSTDVKENPRIYRRKKEAFHQRARKREDLAKGLAANFQFHFRAQVSY